MECVDFIYGLWLGPCHGLGVGALESVCRLIWPWFRLGGYLSQGHVADDVWEMKLGVAAGGVFIYASKTKRVRYFYLFKSENV